MRTNKKDSQPLCPEGYVPQYKIQHRLFLFQHESETQRVGWRHQIEAALGIRYTYWRDVSYKIFPPQWMLDLQERDRQRWGRPAARKVEEPEPAGKKSENRQLRLWDERPAA